MGTPPAVQAAWVPVRPPDGGLQTRNIVCDCDNSVESEHFVVWWGDRGSVTEQSLQPVLDAFERAWDQHVEELGYPPPAGCETYKFNVYVGNTGQNTPASTATGYFWTDAEGLPYVVYNRTSIGVDGYSAPLAVHEFFHAMQHSTGNYPWDDHDNRWFWEATAQWAAGRVFPDGGQIDPLTAYALFPHEPVDWYVREADDPRLAAHHYGVFPWPEHLAETYGDDVIRDAWTGVEAADPTEGLRAVVEARGGNLDVDFLDQAARNVHWDFPAGDAYEAVLQATETWDEYDNIVARELPADGGLRDGPDHLRPFRYGTNTIAIDVVEQRFVEVVVEGDESGDRGSPGRYGARLVAGAAGEALWTEPLDFEDVRGTARIELTDDVETLHLVVGAWTDDPALRLEERFAYQASAQGRACGCASAGVGGSWWWAVLLLIARIRGRHQGGQHYP